MLADMPQNWNNQPWSNAIFDDESMVSLYHSGRRAHEFRLFLGYNNLLAFQRTRRKTRTCPLQLYRMIMNISLNNTWGQCLWFQFWCLCANMRRRRWSGVSLGHWSAPPWPWALKEILFCIMIQRRAVFFWFDRLQYILMGKTPALLNTAWDFLDGTL